MKPQLLTGARGQVMVGNKVLAYITDISIDAPQSVRAVHTFGAPNARSVEPLQAGPCTVSIGRVVPVNDSKGKPIDVSAISEGLAPTIATMLSSDDITINLLDKETGTTYASVRNCRYAGGSLNLSASNLASERLSFMGIYDAGKVSNGAAQNTPSDIGF